MDDSHSYVMPEQAADEIQHLLRFLLGLLEDFGLSDFYLELSTRDPESDKFIGSAEQWEEATRILEEAATETGLELVPDPGGAAFYGPKISVQARDAIGRTWQMSTVQYDFNQPAAVRPGVPGGRRLAAAAGDDPLARSSGRSSASWACSSSTMPVRSRLGWRRCRWSASRSPTSTSAYLSSVADRLRADGIRVEVDASDDRMQKKIRNAQKQKVPFMLIAGDEDMSRAAVSFRYRDGTQKNGVPVDAAVAEIVRAVRDRVQV